VYERPAGARRIALRIVIVREHCGLRPVSAPARLFAARSRSDWVIVFFYCASSVNRRRGDLRPQAKIGAFVLEVYGGQARRGRRGSARPDATGLFHSG
jgi:hypothetical protein